MFLNQSPWKVEGEEWEAKRNLGWVFVFVGWRQILVINPYGVTDIYTGTHTCTHTHIHGLNLIRYMASWPVLLWWDLSFFPSLSPFSPAESYFRFVTCSLVRPYACAHTWLHPHSPATQTAVWKTVWRWRLLWLLDSLTEGSDLGIEVVCGFLILLVVNLKMFSLMVFWQRPCWESCSQLTSPTSCSD